MLPVALKTTVFTRAVFLSILSLFSSGIAQSAAIERLSLFIHDGVNTYEDRRVVSPQSSLPTGVTAQFTANTNLQGEHTWEWALHNTGGASLNNLRVTVLLDADITPEDNTFHNEHGQLLQLIAPVDHIAADKWEIGELGYLHGDMLMRATNGALTNQANHRDASTADDTAMALSFNIGRLDNDEALTVTATFADSGTEGLLQADAHNNNQHVFQAYAKLEPITPKAIQTVDYTVTKTTTTPNINVGDPATYIITMTNNGPDDGTGVTLTDTVPNQINNVTWACTENGTAICDTTSGSGNAVSLTGQVPTGAGNNLIITINGTVISAGTITNTATISPSDATTTVDNNPSNNTGTATITINGIVATGAPFSIPSNSIAMLALIVLMLLFVGGIAVHLRKARKLPMLCLLVLTFGLTLNADDAQAIFLNGDFETGDFNNWATGYGTNYGLSGSHPFRAEDINISAGGTKLLEIVGHTFDPRAPQLTLPRQGNFTAKVNDESNSYHLNYISQKDTLTETDRDPTDGKLHVRFTYAAVLSDPSHGANSQPYFYVQLKDLTTGEILYYDFAYSNQPGRVFFTTYYSETWRSTPFIDVDMEVPDTSLGHELEVRVLAADCSQGGHGGYVYVDAFGAHAIPPQGGCLSGLKARGKPGMVQLVWPDNGAVKYRIYRAPKMEGPYEPIGETESRYATWLDRTVETGKTYYYNVRPLNGDDAEICTSGEVIGVAPSTWSPGDSHNRPPYFISVPIENGDIRTAYVYKTIAIDADGDALTYSLIYAPIGMTIDPSTGQIDWQPAEPGFYRANVAVGDGNGHTANQAFTIEVTDSNRAPVIGNPLPVRVPANISFSHNLQVTDPDGDQVVYAIGSQASGLTISTNGVVSWSSPQPGRYPVTVVAADIHGAKVQQLIVLEVHAFPKFVSYPVIRGTVNTLYSYQAQAEDADSPILEYSLTNAPTGMAIDKDSGLIQWTPTATSNYNVTVQAKDPDGNAGTQTFTIRVTTEPNRAPYFTATPVVYIAYPNTYSYTASATDPDGDTILWSLLQGPTGMEIVETSGRITWKPDLNTEGTFTVEVQVTDQRGGIATQTFDVRVPSSVNKPPQITSTPTVRVTAGQTYTYNVSVSDPDGEAVTLALKKAPAAMALTDKQIRWETTIADIGQHEIEIEASDPRGGWVVQTWMLEVVPASSNRAPRISSTPTAAGTAGRTYTYQVSASDPDNDPITYSLETAPASMTISASGRIEWTIPDGTTGTFDVEIKVSDDKGAYALQSYAIGVGAGETGNRPPVISSTPSTAATIGTLYAYQISASDPDHDTLTYTLNTAPDGMTISAANRIEWTPTATQNGYHSVEIEVTDGKSGVATQAYTIYAQLANNSPPRITSEPVYRARPGISYQYSVVATDPNNDSLTYSLTEAPAGMSISTLGLVNWPNPIMGNYPVTVKVNDPHGAYVTQSYTLQVGTNSPPEITSIAPTAAIVGASYSYQIVANDPDGDFLTYQLVTRPTGMVVSGSGLIEWTPTSVGAFNVTLRVSDGQASKDQSFTINVKAEGSEPFVLGLQAMPQFVAAGEEVTIQALPTGGSPPYTVTSFRINNQNVTYTGYQAIVSRTAVGKYAVQVTLRDSKNVSLTQATWFAVSDGTDTTLPVAIITVPGDSTDITVEEITTLTDIIGTAFDDNFAEYTLMISEADKNEWTVIHRSTTSVTDGKLGELNPQTMTNGMYDIGLIVTDLTGNQTSAKTTVVITGEQKIGQFALSFTDFDIDVGGLPLHMTRTYDTRRQFEKLDFGYGWSVDYQNVKIQTNGAPGRSWEIIQNGTGLNSQYCVRPLGSRVVSIRLPDGKIEKFNIKASPECYGWIEFTVNPFLNITFEAQGGTNSTLEATDVGQLRIIGGDLFDYDSLDVANPQAFKLTMQDGTIYFLNKSLGIQQIKDRYGNTLTYNRNGIVHSAGLSLLFTRDGDGRITAVTAPDGRIRRYAYDNFGNLETAADPKTQETRFAYYTGVARRHQLDEITGADGKRIFKAQFDNEGRLISQSDGKGYSVGLTHDTVGNKDTVKDRNGNTTVYFYDDEGNVTEVADALGGVTKYTYDTYGNETSVTDPLGRTTTRQFDKWGNVTEETDPAGNQTKTTYNAEGNPTSIVDALGRETKSAYNTQGGLNKLTDAAGHSTDIGYTGKGDLASLKDAFGNSTTYSYTTVNGKSLKTSETDANGNVTSYEYDVAGNETAARRTVTINGVATEIVSRKTYDANGNVTSDSDATGNSTTCRYDSLDQLIEETDAQGRITKYEYSERGEQTKVTYPDGGTATTEYDRNGNETRTCERSVCTGTTYDALDRPTKVTDAASNVTETVYDAAGQVTKEIDPRGNVTEYEYDLAGRQTKQINALSQETEYEYDAVGNLKKETDAAGNITEYQYDANNRRTETKLATGSILKHQYDAAGRRTQDTDAEGHATQYGYDALGQLTGVTDSQGNQTAYGYDERGQLISQRDAEGRTTAFAYNVNGQRVKRTLPEGQSERWDYDSVGKLIEHTGFDHQTSRYEYDEVGRFAKEYKADGRTINYTYNGYGYLTQTNDSRNGTVSRSPDVLGRPGNTAGPVGTLYYQWDKSSNKTQLRTSISNRIVNYGYDVLNRVNKITAPSGAETAFEYDANGNRTKVINPNGVVSEYGYNEANQLITIAHKKADNTVLASFQYALDKNGRKTKAIETINGQTRTVSYTYDDTGKLTQEKVEEGINIRTTDYEYDKVGNRTKKAENGIETSYVYNGNDQLVSETTGSVVVQYQYDANGNLAQKQMPQGNIAYTWNSDNKLTRIDDQINNKTITYKLDAEGRRVGKTVKEGATTIETQYLIDPARPYSEMVQSQTRVNNGAWQQTLYLHTPDGVGDLIAQTTGTDTMFVLQDGQGSSRLTVDGDGAVKEVITFDAFGSRIDGFSRTANDATELSHLYVGEQFDADANLYHLRARDYDPTIGRFTARDRFKGLKSSPLTINQYLYANADPVNKIDPSGKFSMGGMAAGIAISATLNVGINWHHGQTFDKMATNFLIGAAEGAVFGGVFSVGIKFVQIGKFVKYAPSLESLPILKRFSLGGKLLPGRAILSEQMTLKVGEQTIRLQSNAVGGGAAKHMIERFIKSPTAGQTTLAEVLVLEEAEAAIILAIEEGLLINSGKVATGKIFVSTPGFTWEIIAEATEEGGKQIIKIFHMIPR